MPLFVLLCSVDFVLQALGHCHDIQRFCFPAVFTLYAASSNLSMFLHTFFTYGSCCMYSQNMHTFGALYFIIQLLFFVCVQHVESPCL